MTTYLHDDLRTTVWANRNEHASAGGKLFETHRQVSTSRHGQHTQPQTPYLLHQGWRDLWCRCTDMNRVEGPLLRETFEAVNRLQRRAA